MLKNKNMGNIDRLVRVILGLVLLTIGFTSLVPVPWNYIFLIGVIPLATGLLGFCPLYSLLKMDTLPKK